MPGSVLGGLTGNDRCCYGLTKWMNRIVVCRSAMKAQMEEWKEGSGKAARGSEVWILLGKLK